MRGPRARPLGGAGGPPPPPPETDLAVPADSFRDERNLRAKAWLDLSDSDMMMRGKKSLTLLLSAFET